MTDSTVTPSSVRSALSDGVPFVERHVGPGSEAVARMLAAVGYDSLDALSAAAVPETIAWTEGLDLPAAGSEAEVAAELRELASRNTVVRSMIGLGYHDTHTPAVIRRNVLENPAWYTAYTPYQPEISQGRLEALLAFQTLVGDLTGLPVAGASLLDEPTAAAEAMSLAHRVSKTQSHRFVVDADTHPQTLAVLATRAEPLGIDLVVVDADGALPTEDFFGVLLSYPGSSGTLRDISPVVAAAQARGAVVAVATDLLALTLLTPPGELGADVVVGSAQRLGVPLGFGGPHAGFMSVRQGLERSLPGRLVGVSVDADGRQAYRLALQTREQHIRREKATSNICTAQVLLAVTSALYAAYHGPEGLTRIAERTHRHAAVLAAGLAERGVEVLTSAYFDTVRVRVPGRAAEVLQAAELLGVNLRLIDADTLAISTDETTTVRDLVTVWGAFQEVLGGAGLDESDAERIVASGARALPEGLARTSEFLTHPTFHDHRSETAMLRYLRKLSDKDIALDRAMIPLGSCTMKLNATTEMEPITQPAWADMHPFAPLHQAAGYVELIRTLEKYLVEITGYDTVSLQPNAGSQGEFAGLLAIRGYHRANGDMHRDVCLIPSSAHGTNAASAVMAGMRVVVVACTDAGDVDLDDLRAKIAQHGDNLAALMITYPSTFGVYEQTVTEICAMVHDAGGQVYVDGANLNALVGLAKPGKFGADVSHLNLHKTFCIPHGGGGPGVGPVAVRAHLAPYVPGHPLRPEAGPTGRGHIDGGTGPVSGAPWGSAGILPIPWAYIRLMGGDGLTHATQVAVLSANYVAARLRDRYPVLYTGRNGLVAHECIVDLREITKDTGVTVDDVAKRLVDYGFHAPTMSFPVAGTLMIEPTESEDLGELDRFCDAMLAIRTEIDDIVAGRWAVEDSPLRGAPHTAECLLGEWSKPYSREEAAFPVASLRETKYWPPVRRIDGAYGDRHLVCSCPPPEAFES
ncbi:aminomethyl-transferring glycine dehydrogenase [Longivirga aurantiaca]|uniref:Glycine dehydrogenase (decarboxylating) n=1 Tax=Longivirga aurantiaca TaxID=1837743 RepID=A0ABW1T1Z7_9ACTN